jgi:hypothetical protein
MISAVQPINILESSTAIRRWPVALLLTLVLGLFGSTAWADGDAQKYGHDPKSFLEHLTKKLDLAKEQQDSILPIIEEKHQKMEALHNQMREMRQNAMSQIEAQLTPEQKEKWEKMQEERKEKMKEYREKRGKGDKKGMHEKDEKHE